MIKNKALTGAIILAISAAMLSGCGGGATETTAPADVTTAAEVTTAEDVAADEVTVGGWEENDNIAATLMTEDADNAFSKAMEGYIGYTHEPVALLATQVVAGTNYAVLCKSAMDDGSAGTFWSIVTVYEDLEGNAEITGFSQIDPLNPVTTSEDPEEGLTGAWEVVQPAIADVLPEEAQEAFEKAAATLSSTIVSPIALIATQVVAGTNYMVLCEGPATNNDVATLYMATVYEDLEGKAEVLSMDMLDLNFYISNGRGEPTDTSTGALTDADMLVEFGDATMIEMIAKDAQNFEMGEGTTIYIDGLYDSGVMTPSINEEKENGDKVGISLFVDGDWDAPADGTEIEIKGTFKKGDYYMELHVDPANIVIK